MRRVASSREHLAFAARWWFGANLCGQAIFRQNIDNRLSFTVRQTGSDAPPSKSLVRFCLGAVWISEFVLRRRSVTDENIAKTYLPLVASLDLDVEWRRSDRDLRPERIGKNVGDWT